MSPVAAGIAIGAGLGIVNLVVGSLLTRRSLQHDGIQSATTMIAGGFVARLVLLTGLFILFQTTTAISAPAFGLTFIGFFFLYVAVEFFMVERMRAKDAG